MDRGEELGWVTDIVPRGWLHPKFLFLKLSIARQLITLFVEIWSNKRVPVWCLWVDIRLYIDAQIKKDIWSTISLILFQVRQSLLRRGEHVRRDQEGKIRRSSAQVSPAHSMWNMNSHKPGSRLNFVFNTFFVSAAHRILVGFYKLLGYDHYIRALLWIELRGTCIGVPGQLLWIMGVRLYFRGMQMLNDGWAYDVVSDTNLWVAWDMMAYSTTDQIQGGANDVYCTTTIDRPWQPAICHRRVQIPLGHSGEYSIIEGQLNLLWTIFFVLSRPYTFYAFTMSDWYNRRLTYWAAGTRYINNCNLILRAYRPTLRGLYRSQIGLEHSKVNTVKFLIDGRQTFSRCNERLTNWANKRANVRRFILIRTNFSFVADVQMVPVRSNAIALYLLEPMLCEYKLVVRTIVFWYLMMIR